MSKSTITTHKPSLPELSKQTQIDNFIGSTEQQNIRKTIIDPLTNQRYVKFNLEILEHERNEMKTLSKIMYMKMNDFIIEAIREKMERHKKELEK